MGKFIDLTGQRFGHLIVIKRAPNKNKQTYWECQCDCGTIKEIKSSNLRSGITISCGCIGKSYLNPAIDITGQKFNRLTALHIIGKKKNTQTNLWECQCDCGNLTTATVSQLKSGTKQSCGCLNKEMIAQIGREAKKDITNQRFGLLTALYPTEQRKSRSIVWHCKCDCGNEYDVSGVLLRNGEVTSCGCKQRSNEEQTIFNLLKNKNINFEEQKSFSTCYNPQTKKLLYFDFYINNQYLLEFDGIQHFKSSTGWNTPEKLKLVQERDQLKNQWCKDNNIPLIRIPYWHLQDLCIEDLQLETSKFIMGVNMNKLDIAKKIIEQNYEDADCGIFNTPNIMGDPMTTIYRGNELIIDICYHYAYFEVFGLSNNEFDELEKFYNTLDKEENE